MLSRERKSLFLFLLGKRMTVDQEHSSVPFLSYRAISSLSCCKLLKYLNGRGLKSRQSTSTIAKYL